MAKRGKKAEPANVQAGAGVSANSKVPGLGAKLEAAMSAAAQACFDEGLSMSADADEVKARMQAARAEVLAAQRQ